MTYSSGNRYDNRNGNRNDARYGYGGNQRNFQKEELEKKIPFPEAYVDFADTLMQEQCKKITTSKLRNLLSLFMDIYNVEILRTEQTVCQDSMTKLQMARIRIAYECGRDNRGVGDFVKAANLLPWLKEVGNDRSKVIQYIHYLEALTAYHRYYGGREN